VAVTGNVFRLASGSAGPDPINFVARVGDVVSQDLTITNTATADGFSENLDASASVAGNASVSGGPITALAAGVSNSTAFDVSASTATAGVSSGTVTVSYESNGAAFGLGPNVAAGTQEIDVNTTVYAEAVANVTPTVDFGTVRVGSTAASSIVISNTGTGALVDDLRETSRSVDTPFSVDPLGGDVAAGDSAILGVAMDTSVAGVYSGGATLGFASHNQLLADLDLGFESVSFGGTVNNLASAAFVDVADADNDGLLSSSGLNFLLDFGTIFDTDLGVKMRDVIGVKNTAVGPADSLAGSFTSLSSGSCAIFCLGSGELSFDPFSGLTAQSILDGLAVELDTSTLGLGVYQDSISLNARSTLLGFDDIFLDVSTLTFRINVREAGQQVPIPGTLLLLLMGLGIFRRQRRLDVTA
jgi:hypothetical protein